VVDSLAAAFAGSFVVAPSDLGVALAEESLLEELGLSLLLEPWSLVAAVVREPLERLSVL
jgi:hypothetical protein